jgi:hypothetical protein
VDEKRVTAHAFNFQRIIQAEKRIRPRAIRFSASYPLKVEDEREQLQKRNQ